VIVYLDSSTILRIILGQSNALKEWRSITRGVVSALVEVECLRTLDRLRLAEGVEDAEIATRREAVYRLLDAVEVVELTRPVLARASQPMPTALGTLDAIHLATALLWKDRSATDLVLATHDGALATAARASGLRVLGVSR
jgi:predicted nucleic acid-binding protein